jgi:hypothetical protein
MMEGRRGLTLAQEGALRGLTIRDRACKTLEVVMEDGVEERSQV